MRTGSGHRCRAVIVIVSLLAACASQSGRSDTDASAPIGPFAEFVEPDFPFFSSVLDARKAGAGFPDTNLTPRGIILNLGLDCWAAFDPEGRLLGSLQMPASFLLRYIGEDVVVGVRTDELGVQRVVVYQLIKGEAGA